MEELISRIVVGMSYGSVYALLAVGLVLTYKTSGVFNLAYGAQAFVSGAIYYDLRVRHEWPIPAALLIAVLIVAPLLGLLLDRALFRYLRNASAIAKLVTALALLVAIPQILKLWFGQNPAAGTQGIVPNGDTSYNPFGDVFVSRNDLATILVTLLAVIALTLLFRYTSFGLQMRAVVESARLTELAGINAERVSTASWVLCSFLLFLVAHLRQFRRYGLTDGKSEGVWIGMFDDWTGSAITLVTILLLPFIADVLLVLRFDVRQTSWQIRWLPAGVLACMGLWCSIELYRLRRLIKAEFAKGDSAAPLNQGKGQANPLY